MATAVDALAIAVVTVGVSAAVGYGIFRTVAPKGNAQSPTQMGRKWFAWMALVSTVTLLPKFFRTFAVDPFAAWIINLVILGGIAFALGWVYAKFKGLKSPAADVQPSASAGTSRIKIESPALPKLGADATTQMEHRLEKLDELFRKGTITKNEYEQQRNRILSDL